MATENDARGYVESLRKELAPQMRLAKCLQIILARRLPSILAIKLFQFIPLLLTFIVQRTRLRRFATHENGWSIFVFEGNPKVIPFSEYKQGLLSEYDYQLLKKQVLAWTKQSLVIEFIKNPYVSIQISRNHHASCGLFVIKKDTSLYLHWDPVELYQYLEGTDILDKNRCAAFLTCRWHYGVETLFKDIKQLPERVVLSLSEKGLSITRPPHLAPLGAKPLKAGADPVSMLHHLVAEEIKGYALPSPYAAELSSGLDTALVAHNLTKV